MAKKKNNPEVFDVFSSKTAEKVKKLEEKRAELVSKRNVINDSIKEIDKELNGLKAQWQDEKIAAILSLAKSKGFNIDDLYNAAKDGDFLTLQDKIDNNETVITAPKEQFTDADFEPNETETSVNEDASFNSVIDD